MQNKNTMHAVNALSCKWNVSHKHDAASGCDTASEQPERVFSFTSLEINVGGDRERQRDVQTLAGCALL